MSLEDKEIFETANSDNIVTESSYSRIHELKIEEEKLIDEVVKWDRALIKLQEKTGYRPRYQIFDYRSRNLYNMDRETLEKILRNIINQIYDILKQMGHKPEDYYKYRSNRYKLNPGFARYWISKIAPARLAQNLFPHFLSEVSLDELDMEYLNFIGTNLSSLCQLELSKLEWLIENGNVKESDVIKTIRKDLLQRPNVNPLLRREVEDDLIRYELSHKPEKQQRQLVDIYRRYCEVMDQRNYEKQQELLRNQGLRRREELQRRLEGKPIKRKETLGTSAAEEICKRLSSESRRKRNKT